MISPFKVQVRFVDVDVMGHVNNAVYLNYFESARMHYFNFLLGEDWDWNGDGIILLKNEIEYLKPVLMHHQPMIKITVEHIGTKSFVLGYELTVDNNLYCKGSSVLVGYDNVKGKSIEIPALMKKGLMELKEEQ